jgi:hypothetical protein
MEVATVRDKSHQFGMHHDEHVVLADQGDGIAADPKCRFAKSSAKRHR